MYLPERDHEIIMLVWYDMVINLSLQGYDCTVGCSRFIDKPYEEDSVIVQVYHHQYSTLY
jgi:hypothetical protein